MSAVPTAAEAAAYEWTNGKAGVSVYAATPPGWQPWVMRRELRYPDGIIPAVDPTPYSHEDGLGLRVYTGPILQGRRDG